MNNSTQTIKVKLKDDKYIDELCDYLAKEYPTGEWDIMGNNILCNENGETKYYAGKYWGRPEDCYPDDYDVNFEIYDGDVENSIEKFVIEKEIELDWTVTSDIEMWGWADD